MNIIVAVNYYGGIGLNNSIPWENKKDMQFFKMMTYGKTVFMGRKTYESLGKPLNGRVNCVLSSLKINDPVVVSYTDKDKFLTRIMNEENGFVIGGEKIYDLVLDSGVIKNIYLSVINDYQECDKYFNFPTNLSNYFKCVSFINFEDMNIQRWVKN